jgi:hypothetical protein
MNGGWLSRELMDDVAAYLDLPAIAVYEVATFYSMYELKPVGKHKVCVCTNVSCMINGSDKIVEHLENKLRRQAGRDHGRRAVHAQGGRVPRRLRRRTDDADRPQGLLRESHPGRGGQMIGELE